MGIISYAASQWQNPTQATKFPDQVANPNPFLEQMPQAVDMSAGYQFAQPAFTPTTSTTTSTTSDGTSGGFTNPFGQSPFANILPGDAYPGPSPENPWGTPPLGSGQPFFSQLGKGTATNVGQPPTTGAPGDLQMGTFDKSKYTAVPQGPGVPGGFIPLPDPTKQNDSDGFRAWYEALRRALGLGPNWSPDDIEKLRPYFEQLGIKFQAKPGEKWSSRIYIPDGHGGYFQVDTRGGQGESGWVLYGHTDQSMSFVPGYKPGGGSSTGGGGGGSTGGGSTGGGSSSFLDFLKSIGIGSGGNSPWDQRANDLFSTLTNRANQSLQIGRNDPIIRNQADAFAAQQTRAARNFLNSEAERSGPFSNQTAERRSANEKIGQSTSAFEAQLMASELTARREEIAQALQMMGSLLTTEQQLALTRELGIIDAALRHLSITNQNNQFYDQFGFNVQDRAAVLDLIRRGLV